MSIPTFGEYQAAQKQKHNVSAARQRLLSVFIARYRWPEESFTASVKRSMRASPYLFKGMTPAQVTKEVTAIKKWK